MRYVQSVARVTEATPEAMPKGANFAGPSGAAWPCFLWWSCREIPYRWTMCIEVVVWKHCFLFTPIWGDRMVSMGLKPLTSVCTLFSGHAFLAIFQISAVHSWVALRSISVQLQIEASSQFGWTCQVYHGHSADFGGKHDRHTLWHVPRNLRCLSTLCFLQRGTYDDLF